MQAVGRGFESLHLHDAAMSMTPPHALEIAAADLVRRGMSGRRQRIVLAEFAASVVVGVGVSAFALAHAGVWGFVVGIAALGFAANYGLLLTCAIALLRAPDVLGRLASSPEWPERLRKATRQQLWLFVPFSLVLTWRLRAGSLS